MPIGGMEVYPRALELICANEDLLVYFHCTFVEGLNLILQCAACSSFYLSSWSVEPGTASWRIKLGCREEQISILNPARYNTSPEP